MEPGSAEWEATAYLPATEMAFCRFDELTSSHAGYLTYDIIRVESKSPQEGSTQSFSGQHVPRNGALTVIISFRFNNFDSRNSVSNVHKLIKHPEPK